ncbi:MAG: ATP-binding protein [Acidobacteriota bacterium]
MTGRLHRTRLALRTRLAIWFAASVLLILSPFLAGVLALEWQSMRRLLDHHLEEDLEVAAEMLVVRDGAVTWRTDAERDYGYDAGVQRWVEAYDPGGRQLYARGAAADARISASLSPPSDAALGFLTLRTPAGAHVRTFTADRRIGGVDTRLRVARSEDGLRADILRLVILFSLVAPLAVLAAAVSGYAISGRALAPLSRMAERARTISAERLSERLPVENPHDELGQLAAVFNDTFGRLEESFDRLKRFTADASHELRTPLTAIRSVGEVGLREARTPDEYQEVIGSMLEEADRLARLVDTLLMLARWESGRVEAAPEAVDVAGLAADVVGKLAILAEERDVRLTVRAPRPTFAWVDASMIRQAVINVVDNAIKFTAPGGAVEVHVSMADGAPVIVVDDEGPGIPENEQAKVLERFYRIGGDRSAPGAGLGLAIAHRALTANDARLTIGTSPGGGARLTMVLPPAGAA